MMLIYSQHSSPRLSYVLDVVLHDILHTPYQLTQDPVEYAGFSGVKWSYGPAADLPGPNLPAASLLFETDVRPQPLCEYEWNGYRLFFPVSGGDFFPFDFLALAFYLISRYEEYLADGALVEDVHGRYRIEYSVAYRYGFHRLPLVQILAREFACRLQHFYPDYSFTEPPFSYVYTCDVDIAYKYKGKGFLRWNWGVLKALCQRQGKEVLNFFRSALGMKVSDPFDVFDEVAEFAKARRLTPIYFIPVGDFSKYDKNIRHNAKPLKDLLSRLSQEAEIGLHPSYMAGTARKVSSEKKRLESVLGRQVTKTRQHFLRWQFPEVPRHLLQAGLADDYTLGWSAEVGFRSSIAVPHHWFDLTKNEVSDLVLHPLAVMDVALARVTADEGEQQRICREISEVVREYGGELVVLNHNTSKFIGTWF